MAHDAARALFEGPLVTVKDWRCDGHDSVRDEQMGDFFGVVFQRRGVFVRDVEGVRTVADTSVASFWSAKEVFRVKHLSPIADRCTILRFTPAVVPQLFEVVAPSANDQQRLRFAHRYRHVRIEHHLAHLRLIRSIERGCDPVEAEERAVELAVSISGVDDLPSGVTSAAIPANAREVAMRVREVMAKRFLEPLSLTSIARDVNCSPFHLSRMFVAAEGIRIHELLVQLRLREALSCLLDSDLPVGTIALQTGFSSHSHFASAFRATFGRTPTDVRKRGP